MQERFLSHIADMNSDIKSFVDISAEGQVALMYMNTIVDFYDELQNEVDKFLKSLELKKGKGE
jgi:hypothetical protein